MALRFERDERAGHLRLWDDDHLVFGWRFGEEVPLPHCFPLRTPSGRDLLTETPELYPHHQGLWLADKVQPEGGKVVDFYHYPKNQRDPADVTKGYHHAMRERSAPETAIVGSQARMSSTLDWVIEGIGSVVTDRRRASLELLPDREWVLDLSWEWQATSGPVRFLSDWIHYGWPYLRLHPQYSPEKGGRIVDDQGRVGSDRLHGQYANWVDASATIEGVTEGVAIFRNQPHEWCRWLARDYGTFGPRRPDRQSGTNFTLAPGESLTGSVRILVHRGDEISGKIASRYRQFMAETPR